MVNLTCVTKVFEMVFELMGKLRSTMVGITCSVESLPMKNSCFPFGGVLEEIAKALLNFEIPLW